MKVPRDPHNPTHDDVFNVSFWRWLTSSASERKEWVRRRQVAGKIRIQAWDDRTKRRIDDWAARQERQVPVRPPRPPRPRYSWLERLELSAYAAYLILLIVPLLLGCICAGWFLWEVNST